MTHKIRLINARDFISATSDEVLNLEEGEKLLRDVVGVAEPLEHIDILLDTREAASMLSAADLWYLADRLTRYPKTFAGRTAILCPHDRFDHANFFAQCAGNKGVKMQAFTSYEDAMNWLSAG